ncbi:MFS transporter [Acerihabitans sp.]|uniref:MFS transporter n=1 Tax=Acerihabitans sp. TaxID=2811394 RepID=UPI002ED9C4DD
MNKTIKTSHYRWWVMSFIFVTYTVANADRANIGFAIPYIQDEFHLSNTMAGILISLFFAGYAINQIPVGFLISKIGVRKSFTIGMLLTSLFTGMMGLVNSIWFLKALRFLVGICEAPVVIGSTVTINNWFPAREKGTATGIFLAGSKVGPLIVPPICAWIIINFGWREIFVFFAIPGMLLSLFWYFMVNNRPEESRFVSGAELRYIQTETAPVEKKPAAVRPFRLCWIDKVIRTRQVTLLKNSKEVFGCWDIYGAALGYFFMVGIVSVLMSWLPKYLIQEKGFAIMNSALLAAAPFAGTVLGNFLGGWFSDRVLGKRRKPLMLVSALVTIFSMYSLVYAPENMALLAILLFVTGLFLSLGYSAFSVYAMGRTDKATYPIAYGVINMGGQLGGMVTPLIVGIILDYLNWNAVFIMLASSCVLCLIFVMSIVEPLPEGVDIPQAGWRANKEVKL